MKPNVLERLRKNELVADSDKQAFYRFYDIANQVQFGKIAPRQEGYILGEYKLPRCTSILQMDGSKAGALMEWAKRQVADRIYKELEDKIIHDSKFLSTDEVYNICQLGLMDPDRQKDEAADVGTGHHDNFENWLTGYDYEKTEALERFKKGWEATGYVLVASEIPVVWHDDMGKGFGGRVDLLLYKDGKFVVGDNKTSRSIHESYGCQVAAYKAAIEQMSHGEIKIDGGVIFHVPAIESLNERQKKEYDKRGTVVELKNLEEAFEHYRLLLGLYYMRNNKYF